MYLNCKTYFSFHYGTFSTRELVESGVDKGVTALALTNINSTCDVWEFVKICRKQKVKPIVGAEIRNGDKLQYLLIAANNKGYAWINQFLSEHLMAKKDLPEASDEQTFFENGWDGFVIYPVGAKKIFFNSTFWSSIKKYLSRILRELSCCKLNQAWFKN